MSVIDHEQLASNLRPAAPPLVIEGVYTDDQHARLLGVAQEHGPWPTITAHHFRSVEELIATSSGMVPKDHGLTLDAIATANFRGFLAENSCVYYPEIHDCFYNAGFIERVKQYWGAQYAKPTMMLFNICGPHNSGLSPHLDAVTFRGVRFENTPVWMQNVMGKSGLFRDHIIKMAQIVTWFWQGEEGTFTICSFWLVSALTEIGEVARAKQLLEKLLSLASPLELYAEEIDPRSGRHLGNFPQAFTHLALINAVIHVIRAEEQGETADDLHRWDDPT